ncbi:MAG TPA: FAD-binding oxidoreductase [Solirubrobacteraceae bacterium]|nr:FAD-binding oxidoreductase [Solirubrobacteraceae bacterium]
MFDGTLLRRGDPGFEAAACARVFNHRRDERRPAAVLLAASVDDVVAGVRLARDEGLRVSVRSGGHSWAAWGLREEALLIDLAGLRELEYDEDTHVVRASPSTKGGLELTPFVAERGRSFPGGHCPRVGIGGFLLQGGQGWDGRRKGWACESVVAIDAVTAAGQLVHATEDNEHADLLWAARGAGPGFPAVVVRFHLRTWPAPGAMTQDTWTFHLDDLEPLLDWLHEVVPQLEAVVEPVVAATRLPSVPLHDGVEHPGGPVLLLHTTAMCDTDEEAERVLAPLSEEACPLAVGALGHVRSRTDVLSENEAQAEQNPEGHRYAVDCQWTDAPASELAPRLRAIWGELPTIHSFSIWYGWFPRRELPDMAFSLEGEVYLATYAIWKDEADDERHRSWVVERTRALAEVGKGVYLGDTDFTRRPDTFMAPANLERLEGVRAAYDGEGRICSYLYADDAQAWRRGRPA